ncbi:MAG: hypothetical protein K0S41_2044 [Anaerocolumna sp.]|jgi:transcription elongation factor Elf1|nr:hypothetical protein [Anaerocolumna sp.]
MKKDKGEFITSWTTCKLDIDNNNYENCKHCRLYFECLLDAEDSRDGYDSFEDMILSGGYDSMDDFWECNGI